jgi:hypothetical protein
MGRLTPIPPRRWGGKSIPLRAARELARRIPGLEWVNVTTFADSEDMVYITTPRCAYCGTYSPEARCEACGASIVRDGDGR